MKKIRSIPIMQNKDIKSIFTNNKEYKISQNAEDTLLALEWSPKSLFDALETIEFYSSLQDRQLIHLRQKIALVQKTFLIKFFIIPDGN